MTRLTSLFLAAAFLSISLRPALAAWPQFRGTHACGVDDGEDLPVTWNLETGDNVRWQTAIPGLAHASPIVWGDRVYVATALKESGEGELKVGLYGDIAPVQESETYQWRMLAIDTASGKVMWNVLGCESKPKVKRHPKATHCNSTPATDGQRIVSIFGSEGLFCFDREGKLVWKRDLGPMASAYFRVPSAEFGFGSSPVIHEGKVIVLCDVLTNSFLAAFDLSDGKELWRTSREDVPTWGTPTVVEAGGGKQIVVNGWHHSGGYDLTTGRDRWRLSGGGDVPVPTPIYSKGLIYLTSAHGGVAPLRAIRADAAGDVTPANPGQTNAAIVWAYPRKGNYMQTPIVVGDRLFACNDSGALSCFSARTGETLYTGRLGEPGQGFTASPVSDGRHLFFTSEKGAVVVIEASDRFLAVATNDLHETCLSTPAISEGTLYFRTRSKLIAVAALDKSGNADYGRRISATQKALQQRMEGERLAQQGRDTEAEKLFRESLAGLRPVLPPDDAALAQALAVLAGQLFNQAKFNEAETLARECLAIREKRLPGDWSTWNAMALLGRSLLGEKRYADAEPLLTRAFQNLKARQAVIPDGDKPKLEQAFQDLVRLYQTSGQTDKATTLIEQRRADLERPRFNAPDALAVDRADNVYVAESNNNLIRKLTPTGQVSTLAGSAQRDAQPNPRGDSADGKGSAARFQGPAGLAVDSGGNVYVADQGNGTIRKISAGGLVSTLAGRAGVMGSTNGSGGEARFAFPSAVAVDIGGNLYVLDAGNSTIRKLIAAGTNWAVTTIAGQPCASGSEDGTGSEARFNDPSGIAVDREGNLYVSDQGNNTIRKVTPRGTNWVVTTLAGQAGSPGSQDGQGSAARFNYPAGVAIDSQGTVYVADYGNCTIRKITPEGMVTTVAGLAGTSGDADGTTNAARFSLPSAVAVDGQGNVYASDSGNHTIRKISPAGIVTTLAGISGSPGSTDGTVAHR